MKTKTSFSLSPEAIALLKLLAEKDGISKTAELELAIRERAERRGFEWAAAKQRAREAREKNNGIHNNK